MAEWTSAVGAVQLARLLRSQESAGAVALDRPGRRLPAYRALADGVRLLVLEGRIPVATRLPAERELAAALGVSRTTIAAAYEHLRAAGFLELAAAPEAGPPCRPGTRCPPAAWNRCRRTPPAR